MLRVLLVNDSPQFQQSARRFLSLDDRIEVVGLAESEDQVWSYVEQFHPDLVLIDVLLPDVNSFQMSSHIKSRQDAPRVIIMALDDIQEYRDAARTAQADGFLGKQQITTEFLPLVETLFPDLMAPDLNSTVRSGGDTGNSGIS